jgi:hypothetical protein
MTLEEELRDLGLLPPEAHQKPTRTPPRWPDYVPWKPRFEGEQPPF